MKVQKIKKKKPFINPNAGNVEKGIQFFNNSTLVGQASQAVGEELKLEESLSENQILDMISKHKKLFDDLKDM